MPSTLFDSAGLAFVAYVQVDGATGSTNPTVTGLANSGVTTTRITTGLYQFFLPTGLAQSYTKDLIFVQPKAIPTTTAIRAGQKPVADVLESDSTPFTKTVSFIGVSNTLLATAIDTDFDVLVLRTILP